MNLDALHFYSQMWSNIENEIGLQNECRVGSKSLCQNIILKENHLSIDFEFLLKSSCVHSMLNLSLKIDLDSIPINDILYNFEINRIIKR